MGCPRTYVSLGTTKIRHLIDSGTNLNIISASTYFAMKARPLLRDSRVKAFGFNSKTQIPLLGEFTTHVKFRHKSVMATFLVLDGVADDIIGFSTASALGIIKIECDNNPNFVNTIKAKHVTFSENHSSSFKDPTLTHPELFTGKVGCLKNFKVTLEVNPLIKPIQQPAYPVPFALMKLTKAKLDLLEAKGHNLKSEW
ncbi:MAG: retropepsin-like aspartic protease [Sediminibacterium sp.]